MLFLLALLAACPDQALECRVVQDTCNCAAPLACLSRREADALPACDMECPADSASDTAVPTCMEDDGSCGFL
ncbi:MAG: hypothetical protein Q8P41_01425 [Pseudomonadota bacterium]|nr:hypothetical protein [Pseudomonadota bacterium]